MKKMNEKRYQEVEVFEIPMLFSNARIPDEDVPEGMYRYDLRGASVDPGFPVMIEKNVLVNHAATVLSAVSLDLKSDGRLRLGDGLNFTGGFFSIDQYKNMMAGFLPSEKMEEVENSINQAMRFKGETLTVDQYKIMMAESLIKGKTEVIENAIGQANENLQWNGQEDRYAIYQINEDGPARKNLFMTYEFNQNHGNPVTGADYHMVYSGILHPRESLDSLYEKFNLQLPENYRGHSLSVSDVIVRQRNKKVEAYYVDSFGFRELPDFVEQRQQVYQAYAMFVDTHAVHENSTGVMVDQHEGTWHTIGEMELNGRTFFLMEHDLFPEEALHLIVDGNGTLIAHELENGFDRGALEAIAEYLTKEGIPIYDRRLTELSGSIR